jgi:hypothetical protein
MHWKRKRSSGRNQRPLEVQKSHRNGGFCVSGPLAGGGSISSVAKTKRWYATNVRGVPEMARQSSSGRPTSIRNSVCYIFPFGNWSPGFWDTNWQTAELSTAPIPLARDGSGRDDALRVLACAKWLRWRRRAGDDFHSPRSRCGRIQCGEYRMSSPFHGRAMLGKIYTHVRQDLYQ